MDGLERALIRQNELCHYGTQGMKWYHRRYQNPDGSLTEEGRKHYYGDRVKKELRDARKDAVKTAWNYKKQQKAIDAAKKYYEKHKNEDSKYDYESAKYVGEQMTKEMLKAQSAYEKLNKNVVHSFGQDKGDKITYDDVNGYKIVSGNYRTQGEEAAILGASIIGGNLMAGPITGGLAAVVFSERGVKNENYHYKHNKYSLEYDRKHDPEYKNKSYGMSWSVNEKG